MGPDNTAIEITTECQAINGTTALISENIELREAGEYSLTVYQPDDVPISNNRYSITILDAVPPLIPTPLHTSTPSSTLSASSIGTSSLTATASASPTTIQTPTSTIMLMDNCVMATPTATTTELTLTATQEP